MEQLDQYADQAFYRGHCTMGINVIHAIKFQSVVAPNGLIANLFDPVDGRRHDSGMLADSGLLQQLQLHSLTNWRSFVYIW